MLAGLSGLSACDLINPDEQVPGYVRIERFTYTPGVAGGPATSNITSALVYADNQLLGIFNLPVKVPVLREGIVKFNIRPAIYPDGQRGTRVVYPFYQDFVTTQNVVPGQSIPLAPITSFGANSVLVPFQVSEDFDPAGDRAFTLTTAAAAGTYSLDVVTPGNYGQVTGKVNITDPFFLDSNWDGNLPQRGAAVYLELDYRSTMPFEVGVAYRTTTSGLRTRVADLTVYPKNEWSKLYVNLTDEISTVNDNAATFKVYLKGYPTGDADQFLAIDNVRLVRPQ